MLQFLDSIKDPLQFLPPQLLSVRISRDLICVPLPHEAEQTPKSVQLPNLQSTGQHWVLHCMELLVGPVQLKPPQLDAVSMNLVRFKLPVPQVFEQDPLFAHCDQLQF